MPAFDNDIYLKQQRAAILDRVHQSGQRLYLEFGGKLIDDFHAARVLPGYDPNVKLTLLQQLKEKADIILCIHAADIEQQKVRRDLGITYKSDLLRLIDELRQRQIPTKAIVITRFCGEKSAFDFQKYLQSKGIPVYLHRCIPGYPRDIDSAVSPNGFGANQFIEVSQPLVIVASPGPNSGKMGTCLGQIYHEHQQNKQANYAKFETFPVWNLPLSHPVNIAYEAATADLGDANAIDHFHYEAYNRPAVNYNRDLQAFPLLKAVLSRIIGQDYECRSPTDMGVNCIAAGIVDDQQVREAARREIARRYFHCLADLKLNKTNEKTRWRIEELVSKAKINPAERDVVKAARQAAETAKTQEGKGSQGIFCGAALKLRNGVIVTGKNSPTMHAASSMILNAVKELAEISDQTHLLLPTILAAVARFKVDLGAAPQAGLDVSETLIALIVSANSEQAAAHSALKHIKELQHCDVHLTHIPSPGDEAGLRRLGCSYTFDPVVPSKNLFV